MQFFWWFRTNKNWKYADLMTLYKPVPDDKCNVSIRSTEGYSNNVSVVNGDSSISACSSLEICWREVEKTTNLILNLKLICPIPSSRNRTICPQHTILPWVPSMLDSIPEIKTSIIPLSPRIIMVLNESRFRSHEIIPCEKHGFIKIVLYIDNNVPICCCFQNWSRKLPIYCNHLHMSRANIIRLIINK